MELGISRFGEVEPERGSGGAMKSYRRMQELLEEARLADEVIVVSDVYEHSERLRSIELIARAGELS